MTFLDLTHQIEILDLLYNLNQQQGRTIVIVVHDLNQACCYADYLAAVKEGKVFAAGDPQSVMTEAIVKAVFNLECQIFSDPIAGTPICIPMSQKALLSSNASE